MAEKFLIVSDHVIEGVIQLIGTLLNLQLFSVDFILNVINSLVKLGNVHLSVLESGLCGLVLVLKRKDLLHQLLFPFRSLFKLLHVFTNSFKFFLNSLKVLLSKFCSFKTPLEFSLLNTKLPAQFIKLLFIVNSHLDGSSKIFVKFFNGDFIVHASALNNLNSLEDIVSRLGGKGQLGNGVAESVS